MPKKKKNKTTLDTSELIAVSCFFICSSRIEAIAIVLSYQLDEVHYEMRLGNFGPCKPVTFLCRQL